MLQSSELMFILTLSVWGWFHSSSTWRRFIFVCSMWTCEASGSFCCQCCDGTVWGCIITKRRFAAPSACTRRRHSYQEIYTVYFNISFDEKKKSNCAEDVESACLRHETCCEHGRTTEDRISLDSCRLSSTVRYSFIPLAA